MIQLSTPDILTVRNKNFCNYAGFFGILISVTALFQNFIFFRPHWVTHLLVFIFLFSIASFSLLIALNRIAPLLLIISTTLAGNGLLLLLLATVTSPIVALLFIYSCVITGILYAEDFPEKLRQRATAERTERELWKDKI